MNLCVPSFADKTHRQDSSGEQSNFAAMDPYENRPGRISTKSNPTYILPVAQERTSQWTQRVTNSLINLGKNGSACWARTSDPLINSPARNSLKLNEFR